MRSPNQTSFGGQYVGWGQGEHYPAAQGAAGWQMTARPGGQNPYAQAPQGNLQGSLDQIFAGERDKAWQQVQNPTLSPNAPPLNFPQLSQVLQPADLVGAIPDMSSVGGHGAQYFRPPPGFGTGGAGGPAPPPAPLPSPQPQDANVNVGIGNLPSVPQPRPLPVSQIAGLGPSGQAAMGSHVPRLMDETMVPAMGDWYRQQAQMDLATQKAQDASGLGWGGLALRDKLGMAGLGAQAMGQGLGYTGGLMGALMRGMV